MTEPSDRYHAIARGFTERVEGVPSDRWSAVSPCPDWTAADLVAHVVGTHNAVVARLDETEPAEADKEGDLPQQWRLASSAVISALADPDRASKMTSGRFGDQTFESLVSRLLCTDTLVHTWDLARATSQDDSLDREGVTASMDFLLPLDDAIRGPGGFAPKIEPAPDADEQTRFLNFCGRSV
jgi:uncharacterized protein (TIGR03086 family)